MNSFLRLGLSLLVLLPISVMASAGIAERMDQMLEWGYWYLFMGALGGGISSTFIKTEVDHRLSFMPVAKCFIGTVLGLLSCMSWLAHFTETAIMKLALPSFVLGCLGAPLVVFALTWASDPDTYKKGKDKLNDKLGL